MTLWNVEPPDKAASLLLQAPQHQAPATCGSTTRLGDLELECLPATPQG